MTTKDIWSMYNKYNPIIKYAIKPSLKLVGAHKRPIVGGVAAALSSGLSHYLLIEGLFQASDYFLGTNTADPQTKLAFTNLVVPIHICFGWNMLTNLRLGIRKYHRNKNLSLDRLIYS